jgi:hypothetical protein
MIDLRTSALALLFILGAPAFAQEGQTVYQCSSDGSLSGGLLLVTTDDLQVVAKYKNGVLSEISGIQGHRYGRSLHPKYTKSLSSITYAQLNSLSMTVSDYLTNSGYRAYQMGTDESGVGESAQPMVAEAPDRDDIETSAPARFKASSEPGFRPGERVPPRAGDSVTAMSAGTRVPPRKPLPRKNGDLAVMSDVVSFSARLNPQGHISEISYRDGEKPAAVVRIDAKNPTSSDSVYATVSAELNSIKAYASCCTKSPGEICHTNSSPSSVVSLKTVKPLVPHRPNSAGSILTIPFGRAPGSEAK